MVKDWTEQRKGEFSLLLGVLSDIERMPRSTGAFDIAERSSKYARDLLWGGNEKGDKSFTEFLIQELNKE